MLGEAGGKLVDVDALALKDGVELGRELGVAIVDEMSGGRSLVLPVHTQRLRACWAIQGPVGWSVMPTKCTCRVSMLITNREENNRSGPGRSQIFLEAKSQAQSVFGVDAKMLVPGALAAFWGRGRGRRVF